MSDLRAYLDSPQLSWLECLERIIGFTADVRTGPEGEPLHFLWQFNSDDCHFFEVSFHDDDHLDFHWTSSVTPIEEEIQRDFQLCHHVAFGRIPALLVKDMKLYRQAAEASLE